MFKPARWIAAAGAMTLVSLPALAQTASETGPRYGYGPMMWHGWGWWWSPGMIIGPLMMLIIAAAVVAIVIWLTRSSAHSGRTALDILEQRFARGEIGETEFQSKRKLLQS
ncbi:MAG TPA: SHOCT domain-containing protein [Stellaceae bacterium]|nr:SHOCT domain-containing protein [Stellaceae bacterium]